MNDFLWVSGHLGWGIFAAAVFTCLWVLLTDLCWRLWNVSIIKLATAMFAGWIIGIGLIVLVFQVAVR